jgi:hypothetical protein
LTDNGTTFTRSRSGGPVMPDNEEKRKAAVGVVTPNVDKDEDWRRQVAGVYSFGDGAPRLEATGCQRRSGRRSPQSPCHWRYWGAKCQN